MESIGFIYVVWMIVIMKFKTHVEINCELILFEMPPTTNPSLGFLKFWNKEACAKAANLIVNGMGRIQFDWTTEEISKKECRMQVAKLGLQILGNW